MEHDAAVVPDGVVEAEKVEEYVKSAEEPKEILNESSVEVVIGAETGPEVSAESVISTSTPRVASPRSSSPVPSRGESTSSQPGKPSSPLSALRAHGEKMTWPSDWERVDEDLNRTQHIKSVISVVSPETVSSMMKKHVVYTVKTEPVGYSVRRRYKDFVWLRDVLVARYTGLFVPALPASTAFSTKVSLTGGKVDTEGDFVKNRMTQLHMFAQQICKVPFFRSDPNLHAFVSLQSERDFKIAVEQGVEKLSAYENWRNEGLDAWLQLLDTFTAEKVDTARTVGDFYRQLDSIRSTLDHIDRECRNTGRKAILLAKAMNALTEQTVQWQKLELDLLDPNKNEYLNPHGSRLRILMNQLVVGQTFWSNTTNMIPKIIARVYLSGIQYQFVQVEGFRALLQAREALIRDLERAEKDRLKAIDDREKFRMAPPETTTRRLSLGIFGQKNITEYDDNCAKRTEAVNLITQQLERTTKALIFCEIDRFYQGRVESINQLVGSLAAINLEIAGNTNIKWSEVISTTNIDTNDFTEIVTLLQQTMDDEEIFQEA